MTNGTITKRILSAAKKQSGEMLSQTVTKLLRSFPLSSHKLVYDADQSKVHPSAWETIIAACIETDIEKKIAQDKYLKSMGASPSSREFGREKLSSKS